MKVEIERKTNGERSVHVIANDICTQPNTLTQMIRMLQVAERWLREGKKPE